LERTWLGFPEEWRMRIGFHASHEQWAPSALLRHVKLAENAGFDAMMCSDHFHPWSEDQGQSGFSWSWLGAAMQGSRRTFGTVCAPGQRYHPAIVAQAAATLAEMFPGRFWLAVGSGEALNEQITGDVWPLKSDRNRRLKESVDVMQALWAGETVTHDSLITIRHAKLYTRPADPPLIIGAALSVETARWMAPWVDGLITAGARANDLQKIVAAFRENGGEMKPMFLQTAISFERTQEEARAVAFQTWRQAALTPQQLSDLATPLEFDAATRHVRPEAVEQSLRVSHDLAQHVDWLLADQELGFETVYLHFLGPDVPRFLDEFARAVLPQFQ
jgi:coenzyme F420-dependent glucose-6-phosphate dehydrogenase